MKLRVSPSQIVSALAGVSVLAVAILLSAHWVRTRPKPPRRAGGEVTIPVRVVTAHAEDRNLSIEVFGEVIPLREVILSAEVTGRVVQRHPNLEPGGRVTTGEVLVELDPGDYATALAQAEAALERARLEWLQERARARVAADEWRQAGLPAGQDPDESRDLALRKPQLAAAEAALRAAEANLEQARRNLARTAIRAPFDAIVLERHVEVGQLATTQSRLVTLVAADAYRVRFSVPVDRLRSFALPDEDGHGGARVVVRLETGDGSTVTRTGRVERVLPDLEPAGRMARILATIPDPLTPPQDALRLRSFVRGHIEGHRVESVIRLPAAALREGHRVWTLTTDDRLEIRDVEVLHLDDREVWVQDGLREGDRVVVTALATPIPGMKLRPAEAAVESGAPAPMAREVAP